LVDSKIAIPATDSNAFVLFDMVDDTYSVHRIGNQNNAFSAVCFDGTDYWFAPRGNGAIVRWNPITKTCIELTHFPKGYIPCFGSYLSILAAGNDIWMFPCFANKVVKINRSNNEISVGEPFQEFCDMDAYENGLSPKENFLFAYNIDNTIYAYSVKARSLLIFDTESQELLKVQCEISKSSKLYNLLKECIAERLTSETISETEMFDLVDFIDLLTSNRLERLSTSDSDTSKNATSGTAIYNFCKSEVAGV
jgi:hypothetical protein